MTMVRPAIDPFSLCLPTRPEFLISRACGPKRQNDRPINSLSARSTPAHLARSSARLLGPLGRNSSAHSRLRPSSTARLDFSLARPERGSSARLNRPQRGPRLPIRPTRATSTACLHLGRRYRSNGLARVSVRITTHRPVPLAPTLAQLSSSSRSVRRRRRPPRRRGVADGR